MNSFNKACELALDEWVNSFEIKEEKHIFSEEFNMKIQEIINNINASSVTSPEETKKRRKMKVKYFLIAAIIMLLIATTVFAIPASREYIIKKFSDHSTYSVIDSSDSEYIEKIYIGSLPNGFKLDREYESNVMYLSQYSKPNTDDRIIISKHVLGTDIYFDTEDYIKEEVEFNGIKYTLYTASNKTNGAIWNNGQYLYKISSNLSKEEILEIAKSIS